MQKAYKFIADNTDSVFHTGAFIPVISRLEPEQQRVVIEDGYQNLKKDQFPLSAGKDLFSQLAPHLPSELIQDALEESYKLNDKAMAVYVIRVISPYLRGLQRRQTMRRAFKYAGQVADDFYYRRAGVYSLLAPYLDEPLRTDAIQKSLADLNEVSDKSYERQFEILMRLVDLEENPDDLIKATRKLLASRLRYHSHENRAYILMLIGSTFGQMTPPVIPSQIHADIAQYIIEICEEWQWI